MPSVKKFISQPNPLMNKIELSPYNPKSYYPKPLTKLPKGMRDHEAVVVEKNNMNSLLEAWYQHDRVKKEVLGVLAKKEKGDVQGKGLVTLE